MTTVEKSAATMALARRDRVDGRGYGIREHGREKPFRVPGSRYRRPPGRRGTAYPDRTKSWIQSRTDLRTTRVVKASVVSMDPTSVASVMVYTHQCE